MITSSVASNSGPIKLETSGASRAARISEPRTSTWLPSGYFPFFSPKKTETRPKSARRIGQPVGHAAHERRPPDDLPHLGGFLTRRINDSYGKNSEKNVWCCGCGLCAGEPFKPPCGHAGDAWWNKDWTVPQEDLRECGRGRTSVSPRSHRRTPSCSCVCTREIFSLAWLARMEATFGSYGGGRGKLSSLYHI